MNTNNALAAVSRDEWSVMTEQASMLVKTGFLPKSVDTAEKAVAIMLKGRELNVPAMHALSTITVIQGKPTVSPELMAALVERDYGSNALIVEEANDQRCVVSCWKPGWDKRRLISFTIEESRKANLAAKNPTWNVYPEAMLRSRAISKACKTHFQASIGGMYTPEELGANVSVVDGDVVLSDAPMTITEVFDRNPVVATQIMNEVYEHEDRDEPSMQDEVESIDAMPLDELQLIERTEILQELKALTERDHLRAYKARINAAGLANDAEVKGAYSAAYNRLKGVRGTSDDAQPVLDGVS